MLKSALHCWIIVAALATGAFGFPKDKNWTDVATELKNTKQLVSDLVSEIKASSPSDNEEGLLRTQYDLAKEKYSVWAEEAADRVLHGKDINLKSPKAIEAHKRFLDLSTFATKYINTRKQLDPNAFLLHASTWDAVNAALKAVSDNWKIIQGAVDWINKRKAAEEKKRHDMAGDILASAQWPDFATIK